ncbi:type III secretion system export apparatus subunit SctR [Ramlibacter tataouinensis]|uniref:Candidate translocation protein in type III secretion, membrane protein n=1 Tax=Ramlibacter tataouinensis (strain ATCC BAA-407 / DSM 14655 / LMG 21543 / TTB310) TaxID=365046 RepID=F5Y6J8_RAMTT|nr:type III secretion system export apparatus subunit SctR [Ramlibacter tataouinensis]AEG94072.1 Candidate translocation protein in type III secretion, membrane protein [Ramlibacter tataouinensis TTB310]
MHTDTSIEVVPLLAIIFAIGFLPFVAMMVTSYTKIVVVLGLVRNALGVQQVPPNMMLNGIAIIISVYIVAPLFMDSFEALNKPAVAEGGGARQVASVVEAAREPVRRFLDKHAHAREKAFFLKSVSAIWTPERAKTVRPDDLIILAPAFTLSELTEAFKIGFLIYLAFVVVDLVVANVLLALGLSQVTPTQIAIPFKLLLFVVMDGWSVLLHGLVMTYR